nr:MAG TPA_asm: hypothetical protein [Caudoviricetes sp.]
MEEISGMKKKADSEFSLKICFSINHSIFNNLFFLSFLRAALKVSSDNRQLFFNCFWRIIKDESLKIVSPIVTYNLFFFFHY